MGLCVGPGVFVPAGRNLVGERHRAGPLPSGLRVPGCWRRVRVGAVSGVGLVWVRLNVIIGSVAVMVVTGWRI